MDESLGEENFIATHYLGKRLTAHEWTLSIFHHGTTA